MHARIATFEGRSVDPDDAAKVIKERFMPQLKGLAGYSGYFALADRDSQRGMGIVLFDSEENLREGDRFLNEMSPPDELQPVNRSSVEHYEVLVQEGGEDARAARVSRLEGPPEGIDEGMRHALDSALPRARETEGWRGVLVLGDRSTGRQTLVTFWDSVDAMRASEEKANQLRQDSAQAGRQTISGVERYEVFIAEVRAGAATA
jgi:heme-degrading monooxygenase HmoA